jgi:hypothetical protein
VRGAYEGCDGRMRTHAAMRGEQFLHNCDLERGCTNVIALGKLSDLLLVLR